MTSNDPELGVRDMHALRAAGLIAARDFVPAAISVRDDRFWSRWGLRALLALGVGQFLAGVVFFFAYNWSDLPDLAKFAVIEAALLIAACGALLSGLDRLLGQALLIAASVMTGVLLAVMGQVYQTGADAFELFAAWALLILPWTLVSRNGVHWLLWLTVAEIALALYGGQVLVVVTEISSEEVWLIVGTSIAAALLGRELAVGSGIEWLSARWTRLVLLLAAGAVLFAPAAGYVLDADVFESGPLCLAAFPALLMAAGGVYWRARPDFAAMVMVIGFADALFLCVGFRVIDESIGFDFADAVPALAGFGAMIAWAILGTGSAALAMRRLRGSMQEAA